MTTVLGHPVQIAYAVDPDVDLATAADDFRRRTGAGPFVIAEHIALASAEIAGRPESFDHSSAYGQWGAVMVELVQEHTPPVIGRSHGLHHLAYLVESLDATVLTCRRNGWPPLLDAITAGGQRFVFCDALESLGHLVELYEPSAPLLAFYEHVRDIARPLA
ncbi:MAG: VOC family protein [Actinomycetota bacterium]